MLSIALKGRLREDESVEIPLEAQMISLFETPKKYMARKCAEAEQRARKEGTRTRLELAAAALKNIDKSRRQGLSMARAYSI